MHNPKKILTEAQDQLYHATDISNVLKILNDDAIKFTYSDSIGTEEKLNRGYPFYLSTSREKYGGYARSRTNNVSILSILVLDGKALERTKGIKMFDVDYWGKSYETPENLRHAETEERVTSDHQMLKNVKRYVQEIHIFVPKRVFHDDYSKAVTRGYVPLAKKSKESGIPTYFYIEGVTEKADPAFRQQRKSMSVSADQLIHIFEKVGVYDPAKANTDPAREPSRLDAADIKDLETLTRIILHPEEFINVDYSSDKELYNLVQYFTSYKRELVSHFGTKIHNLRSKHPEVFGHLSKAIRTMKYSNFKESVETTSDIVSFLKDAERTIGDTGNSMITNLRYIVGHWTLDSRKEARSAISRYLSRFLDQPDEKSKFDLNELKHLVKLFRLN